jgi:hypothetical protein
LAGKFSRSGHGASAGSIGDISSSLATRSRHAA